MADPVVNAGSAILTLGTELQIKCTGIEASYTAIPGLQSYPDLGGDAERVDVTTLADAVRQYIPGIKDFGEMEFTFVYNPDCDIEGSAAPTKVGNYAYLVQFADEVCDFKLLMPDDSYFTFSGKCEPKIVGAGVNEAITFNLVIYMQSDIEWADR